LTRVVETAGRDGFRELAGDVRIEGAGDERVEKAKQIRAIAAPRVDESAQWRRLLALTVVILAAAAFLAVATPARAVMYKWVDDKGVVHYTDKLPPEAVDKANTELSKEGIPVKKTDKVQVLTPEQRRAIAEEQEKKRLVAKQAEEVARRDRALMSSYTSEAEIDLARNRSLQTINNVVQSTMAFSDQLNKRKADAEAKKVEFAGRPIVAVLDRELEGIDAELARQADIIAQKKREAEAVTAKYDADKQRWRELVSSKAAADSDQSVMASPAPPAKK
jgi:hypothetical protein